MGATAAVVSIASAGYSTYQSIKAARQKQPNPATPQLPPTPDLAAETRAANLAAQNAAIQSRKKAAGIAAQNNTILTSPQGVVGAPAPGRQTLLGG